MVDFQLLERHGDSVGAWMESSAGIADKLGFEQFEKLYRSVPLSSSITDIFSLSLFHPAHSLLFVPVFPLFLTFPSLTFHLFPLSFLSLLPHSHFLSLPPLSPFSFSLSFSLSFLPSFSLSFSHSLSLSLSFLPSSLPPTLRLFSTSKQWTHLLTLLDHNLKYIQGIGERLGEPLMNIISQLSLSEKTMNIVDQMTAEQLAALNMEVCSK